jgi:hypothetical protein
MIIILLGIVDNTIDALAQGLLFCEAQLSALPFSVVMRAFQ